MSDYSAARQVLLERQEKLRRRLIDLGATESGDLRRDLDFGEGFSDAAVVTAERTETLGLIESVMARLGEVDAALARIDNNTYGICAKCSRRISPERMEARPVSVLCVKCKASHDD